MWDFIKTDKTIRFWGICDVLFFSWYLANSLIKGKIPFYHDIVQTIQTTESFGHPLPILLLIPVIALYISLPFSGKLLYQLNTKGAILSYFQTPFRLLSASPSLFFIHWPISFAFEKPPIWVVIIGAALILTSELAKLYSVISWHIRFRKERIKSALSRHREDCV